MIKNKKYGLNVSFEQKDEVKALAEKNGTNIHWDKDLKSWYWEGVELPEFLKPYFYIKNFKPKEEGTTVEYWYFIVVGEGEFLRVQEEPTKDRNRLIRQAREYIGSWIGEQWGDDEPTDEEMEEFFRGTYTARCERFVSKGKCLLPKVHRFYGLVTQDILDFLKRNRDQ